MRGVEPEDACSVSEWWWLAGPVGAILLFAYTRSGIHLVVGWAGLAVAAVGIAGGTLALRVWYWTGRHRRSDPGQLGWRGWVTMLSLSAAAGASRPYVVSAVDPWLEPVVAAVPVLLAVQFGAAVLVGVVLGTVPELPRYRRFRRGTGPQVAATG